MNASNQTTVANDLQASNCFVDAAALIGEAECLIAEELRDGSTGAETTCRFLTTEQVKNLRSHPLAKLFPSIHGEAYQLFDLLQDIRDHGVVEPIVLDDDGFIVDGRNRRTACEELGLGCPAVPFASLGLKVSVGEYIWSANVIRRHLTDDQRAALVVEWADAIKKEATERSQANLKKGAAVPDRAKSPTREIGRTRDILAKKACVSPSKIRDVQEITASNPEALPRIRQGELRVRDVEKKIRDAKKLEDSRLKQEAQERKKEHHARLKHEVQERMKEVRLRTQLGLQLIQIGYNVLASKLHLDNGGSEDAMTRLNEVRDILSGAIGAGTSWSPVVTTDATQEPPVGASLFSQAELRQTGCRADPEEGGRP